MRTPTRWRKPTNCSPTSPGDSSPEFEVAADRLLVEVDRKGDQSESDSLRVTPLAVIAHALCKALKLHPNFNSIIDKSGRALNIHAAIHLGIAVDSPDGLLVPVIRDADEKSILDIAGEFGGVAGSVGKGLIFGLPLSPAEKASRKKRRK